MRKRIIVNKPVDLIGCDAGYDLLGQHVERASGDRTDLAHVLKGLGAVNTDLSQHRNVVCGEVGCQQVHMSGFIDSDEWWNYTLTLSVMGKD